MRTLLISTLAVGLIGCASQPQYKTVERIVDPVSLNVFELTDAPCQYEPNYPFVVAHNKTAVGCYRISQRDQKIYFLVPINGRPTQIVHSFADLIDAKNRFELAQAQALRNFTPSYKVTPYQPPAPSQPTIQCFGNGFGTVTCNSY